MNTALAAEMLDDSAPSEPGHTQPVSTPTPTASTGTEQTAERLRKILNGNPDPRDTHDRDPYPTTTLRNRI
ncbi:hypothetical protein [Subtercola vilae]|uniref:Uncharacterized protein n=1 Tax=Subtercola vilae TaxID=2056433 RepID=A0A4T2BYF9_9MICO|nr:hypothetical protein [Subtercola vilae]TIH36142.1 hypothetical protein D4765_10170 [Subtercola vilae]